MQMIAPRAVRLRDKKATETRGLSRQKEAGRHVCNMLPRLISRNEGRTRHERYGEEGEGEGALLGRQLLQIVSFFLSSHLVPIQIAPVLFQGCFAETVPGDLRCIESRDRPMQTARFRETSSFVPRRRRFVTEEYCISISTLYSRFEKGKISAVGIPLIFAASAET